MIARLYYNKQGGKVVRDEYSSGEGHFPNWRKSWYGGYSKGIFVARKLIFVNTEPYSAYVLPCHRPRIVTGTRGSCVV